MDKINSKHLIFLIMAVAIISLKTYPTVFTKNLGRNSWIVLILASIIFLTIFLNIVKICNKKKCYNIYTIYCETLGRGVGSLLIFFYIITIFLTLIESCSVEANSMHNNILVDNPVWAYILALIIPSIYIINKNYSAVIAVIVLGIVGVSASGIVLAILTEKYKNYKYLFPISLNIDLNFLKGLFKILGLYGNSFIILPFLTDVVDTAKIKKLSLISFLIVIQIEIMGIIGVITTYGERMNYLSYPKLTQTQLIDLFDFIEFGELYVMLQMAIGWTIKFITALYSIKKILQLANINNKILIYILCISAAVFSACISKNYFYLFNFLNYYVYASFINFVLIPILVFTLYSFR